ncbi:cytochrome c3 family protein [Geotalea sp. SG265]|uniref:cytochrome c3 family protein n=1 Tax=Geotalea sp. SG265 TaxID=2922867 RepID=UPI001FAFD1DD|nr:cytochrome c3 family protein [Geotalea sp. SG265]
MDTGFNWVKPMLLMIALAAIPSVSLGAGLPDRIALDSLKNLYDSVQFNHAGHIRLLKDCAGCHHHTTGNLVEDANCVRCHQNSSETKVVACRGCHAAQPFSAEAQRKKQAEMKLYHQDKPGLKGAYHLNCMGCHQKMGGPTGCKDCHPMNKTGEALYNTGSFAPKKTGKAAKEH